MIQQFGWDWVKGQPAPKVFGMLLVGKNPQGYPEYDKDLGGGVTMRFVLLPAGSFTMGSPAGESERDDYEGPQHEITLDAFLIAKTECTQRQWQAVMGNNPSHFSMALDAPVEQVSWDDIQSFEQRAILTLPSESQWEYAARAESTKSRYGTVLEVAWFRDNSSSSTHPVGMLQPNAFGLHDMLGNVYQWCEDTWHESYDGAPNDGSSWVDAVSSFRVLRGGSWYYPSRNSRSSSRLRNGPGIRRFHIGFRPVKLLR
jgi:formylglycine-generating enzyme required for sulfatase activity